MDTQKVTTQYRFVKVIQARQESGQNIKDFCQATGISKSQYFYWQRKLRNVACTELAIKEKPLHPLKWVDTACAGISPTNEKNAGKSAAFISD